MQVSSGIYFIIHLLIKRTYTWIRCHIKNSLSIMFIHVATVFVSQHFKNFIAIWPNKVLLGTKADLLKENFNNYMITIRNIFRGTHIQISKLENRFASSDIWGKKCFHKNFYLSDVPCFNKLLIRLTIQLKRRPYKVFAIASRTSVAFSTVLGRMMVSPLVTTQWEVRASCSSSA